jgi:hypothetical protein
MKPWTIGSETGRAFKKNLPDPKKPAFMGCAMQTFFVSHGFYTYPVSITLRQDPESGKIAGEMLLRLDRQNIDKVLSFASGTPIGDILVEIGYKKARKYCDCRFVRMAVSGMPGERVEATVTMEAKSIENDLPYQRPDWTPARLITWQDCSISFADQEDDKVDLLSFEVVFWGGQKVYRLSASGAKGRLRVRSLKVAGRELHEKSETE